MALRRGVWTSKTSTGRSGTRSAEDGRRRSPSRRTPASRGDLRGERDDGGSSLAARAHPVTAGITVASADTPGIAPRRKRAIEIASDRALAESTPIDTAVHCHFMIQLSQDPWRVWEGESDGAMLLLYYLLTHRR